MPHNFSHGTNPRTWLAGIGNRNEMAWHILDFGLMHDPDYTDLVALAASGSGNHSQLLSASVGPPDEPVG